MPTTPVYSLPYPSPSDPADIPSDFAALATPLDSIIDGLADRVAALEAVAPAVELAYAETATDLGVTAASAAAAQTYVSSGAVTLTAVPHLIEVFCPRAYAGSGVNSNLVLTLWDGSTDLGRIGQLIGSATGGPTGSPVHGVRRITPSAGSHTYIFKAWRDTAGASLSGTAGGATPGAPSFIRISRVI